LEVSNEQNKLFKGYHELTHVDTTLNIKGKKLQLYREIRKGLCNEGCTLHAQIPSSEWGTGKHVNLRFGHTHLVHGLHLLLLNFAVQDIIIMHPSTSFQNICWLVLFSSDVSSFAI
jgi:hypothetical protein